MKKKKTLRIGINGFGRIGRIATRIISKRSGLTLAAINSRADTSSHTYLLKYDSTYGSFYQDVKFGSDYLKINNQKIAVFNFEDPSEIPWSRVKADLVIEATGKFRTNQELQVHLRNGAKFVVISAPAKDATKTFVLGVNEGLFDPKKDQIISNSSCTTNCLATTLSVLEQNFEVRRGFMTTVHAVTDSQNLLDNSHKKEARLRRAAFASMIPSTTGSAKDIGKLFPHLSGKIICQALRVPLLTVSLINLTVEVKKKATKEQVNRAFEKASKERLKGILEVSKDELVSSDYVGNSHSSIVDPFLTQVLDGNLIKVFAWYDNEWGYTSRLIDMVEYIAQKGGLL